MRIDRQLKFVVSGLLLLTPVACGGSSSNGGGGGGGSTGGCEPPDCHINPGPCDPENSPQWCSEAQLEEHRRQQEEQENQEQEPPPPVT